MPAAAVVRMLRLESIVLLLSNSASRPLCRPPPPVELLFSRNHGSTSFPALIDLGDI
jgi:hypothetical protein